MTFEPQEAAKHRRMDEPARAIAVILWAGFLGAVVAMPVYFWAEGQVDPGLGATGVLFALAWLVACVPAGIVWLLSTRPPLDRSRQLPSASRETDRP